MTGTLAMWMSLFDTLPMSMPVKLDSPRLPTTKRSAPLSSAVVSRRGRGGFLELILGSVSHQLTHHARCPVVGVPRASG
jgi:hypothetical protein